MLFFAYLCTHNQSHSTMTVVSSTDFRAHMGKYLALVDSGERLIIRSRMGCYTLKRVKTSAKNTYRPRRKETEER